MCMCTMYIFKLIVSHNNNTAIIIHNNIIIFYSYYNNIYQNNIKTSSITNLTKKLIWNPQLTIKITYTQTS